MKTLWLKTRRGVEPHEQVELTPDTPLPCIFEIGSHGDWRPRGLREADRLRITFDGSAWTARLLCGDLGASGLRIIGDLVLYAPLVVRLGNTYFFVDDVRDPVAKTISAEALSRRHAEVASSPGSSPSSGPSGRE